MKQFVQAMKLPPIGLRIIKSAIGVFLCFCIYMIRKDGIPFYSALAVLWCIQPRIQNTKKNIIQRTIGTMIGAVYGLIVILISRSFLYPQHLMWHYALISFVLIPVLYTTVVLNKKNTSYFSCVVYLSIVVIHSGDANPYLFVWNRVLDTMIGMLVAAFVNMAHLPRKKRTDILFVSGLDDTLLNLQKSMTAFSKAELNRMLDDGLNFTIATMRTPASIIEVLQDVNLKLPVIAMDGAVLYDMKTHCYQRVYLISQQSSQKIYQYICEHGYHVFTNIIVEDLLIILYGDFTNPAEQELYDTMHTSLYRNYVKGTLKEDVNVVYFMILDTIERIETLYRGFEEMGWTETYKILHYPSEDYPGYAYIKIYNKHATRKNMIHYLEAELQTEQTVRFGSIETQCDVLIHDPSGNNVVKQLHRNFRPLYWES